MATLWRNKCNKVESVFSPAAVAEKKLPYMVGHRLLPDVPA